MTPIESRTCVIVAQALGLPAVELGTNLFEAGAQSLEFLDIVFQLEQEFGIELTRGEIERAARGDLTDDEFAPAGVISAVGLERLRMLMPEAAAQVVPGLRREQILALFTVSTFARMVAAKVAAKSSG
jgi:acyl carrier protein